jgi:hypothetical protein
MGLKCLRDLAKMYGAFLIVRLPARSDTVLSTLQFPILCNLHKLTSSIFER